MVPPLRIAIIAGREPCPTAEDLASGLAARGHHVRFHRGDADYEKVFRRLRADAPDVVSQHAADLLAFAAVEGLPVLHTLHVPPSEDLLAATGRTRAWFATPCAFLARAWQSAGLERIQLIPGGMPSFRRVAAVVRPLALVADRAGALAALRAGLGLVVLSRGGAPRDELARKLAYAAVCIAPQASACGFDYLAAQAQLAGCPVVGAASEPLAEVIEEGVSGFLVPPGDERALADAARRAAMLDRLAVRGSAAPRLAIGPMLDRYESELRAVARRSAVRLVA